MQFPIKCLAIIICLIVNVSSHAEICHFRCPSPHELAKPLSNELSAVFNYTIIPPIEGSASQSLGFVGAVINEGMDISTNNTDVSIPILGITCRYQCGGKMTYVNYRPKETTELFNCHFSSVGLADDKHCTSDAIEDCQIIFETRHEIIIPVSSSIVGSLDMSIDSVQNGPEQMSTTATTQVDRVLINNYQLYIMGRHVSGDDGRVLAGEFLGDIGICLPPEGIDVVLYIDKDNDSYALVISAIHSEKPIFTATLTPKIAIFKDKTESRRKIAHEKIKLISKYYRETIRELGVRLEAFDRGSKARAQATKKRKRPLSILAEAATRATKKPKNRSKKIKPTGTSTTNSSNDKIERINKRKERKRTQARKAYAEIQEAVKIVRQDKENGTSEASERQRMLAQSYDKKRFKRQAITQQARQAYEEGVATPEQQAYVEGYIKRYSDRNSLVKTARKHYNEFGKDGCPQPYKNIVIKEQKYCKYEYRKNVR